jgi:hypothetical protein
MYYAGIFNRDVGMPLLPRGIKLENYPASR